MSSQFHTQYLSIEMYTLKHQDKLTEFRDLDLIWLYKAHFNIFMI